MTHDFVKKGALRVTQLGSPLQLRTEARTQMLALAPVPHWDLHPPADLGILISKNL